MDHPKLNFFIVVLMVMYLAQHNFVDSPAKRKTTREKLQIKTQSKTLCTVLLFH